MRPRWIDVADPQARQSLHNALYRLRQSLDQGGSHLEIDRPLSHYVLTLTHQTVQLNTTDTPLVISSDVALFHTALDASKSHSHNVLDRCASCLEQLRPMIRATLGSVEPQAGKTLVYWGTPALKTALDVLEWPRVYRNRTEIQENSFKRMIDHGTLDINYGRKKMVGPDRHQQRKRTEMEASLEIAQQRVNKKVEALQEQQAKVAESESKGHGQRLQQRQQASGRVQQELKDAQHHHAQLATQIDALGPPKERADRDFRKQTIMTCRTLLLENTLMAFLAALLTHLQGKVSLERVLGLLFERSGACLETASEIVY